MAKHRVSLIQLEFTGPDGRNIGAGQTGGWGYFLDEERDGYSVPPRVNSDVNLQRVNEVGASQLKALIEEHVEHTGSAKGRQILERWDEYLPKFWHVYPTSESEAPEVSGIASVVTDGASVAA